MIGLLQRVTRAQVEIAGYCVGTIGHGLLVFIAVQPNDNEANAMRLLERLLNYRVFPDDAGRMNLSLRNTGGGLLLVPQFTLAAATDRGNRPSFTTAASPELGARLFELTCQYATSQHAPIATGRFGADMQVSLINDGPVTFWLTA
ncbi:D-tyrosyl-tRNA(Tyr) deacylase [Rhodoferax sp. 4810]|uniref:D-aminoacyl-tRNA deacylase n=1 Tax=Thiospirillum jenense TaxID=1653858 RepID=A0A839H8U2_9GAMM|nr:D-aminoacyl-tRNA deacylase [Thiospirillum jenense]MBB1073042.1 D-tyrosyl-tRNA(Tyr) deacylase [Rhodoferax jenense]MBB1124990.1 D-tyrosyl-tRNA(Tyr) deacylase [Thiospirillum jenense]